MNAQDVVSLLGVAKGTVVANHLEALGHCPVTRSELLAAAQEAGLGERLRVPDDGATLAFTCDARIKIPA